MNLSAKYIQIYQYINEKKISEKMSFLMFDELIIDWRGYTWDQLANVTLVCMVYDGKERLKHWTHILNHLTVRHGNKLISNIFVNHHCRQGSSMYNKLIWFQWLQIKIYFRCFFLLLSKTRKRSFFIGFFFVLFLWFHIDSINSWARLWVKTHTRPMDPIISKSCCIWKKLTIVANRHYKSSSFSFFVLYFNPTLIALLI